MDGGRIETYTIDDIYFGSYGELCPITDKKDHSAYKIVLKFMKGWNTVILTKGINSKPEIERKIFVLEKLAEKLDEEGYFLVITPTGKLLVWDGDY